MNWVKQKYSIKKISIIGFYFGGHAALIASLISGIESSFCFNGAAISTPKVDTKFAPIDLLEKVSERFYFICNSSDDLIPLQERLEIKKRFLSVPASIIFKHLIFKLFSNCQSIKITKKVK
tara:strand:+ start:570 stop:932 length:363 start_codon:yes stop_codon:yes gene_type:complete